MNAAVYRPNGPGFSSAERPNGRFVGRERPALARRDRTDPSGAGGGRIIRATVSSRTIGPAGSSAAWLARLLWEQEVAGSNPASPTE